jgi:hypothetical protein
MSEPDPVARARGVVGRRVSINAPREEIEQAQAELAAAVLERRIKKLLESAPPLSPEKKERLRALLEAS